MDIIKELIKEDHARLTENDNSDDIQEQDTFENTIDESRDVQTVQITERDQGKKEEKSYEQLRAAYFQNLRQELKEQDQERAEREERAKRYREKEEERLKREREALKPVFDKFSREQEKKAKQSSVVEKKEPKKYKPLPPTITIGSTIRHSSYGSGEIVGFKNYRTTVSIYFERHGFLDITSEAFEKKCQIVNLAPFEKVSLREEKKENHGVCIYCGSKTITGTVCSKCIDIYSKKRQGIGNYPTYDPGTAVHWEY